MKPISIFLTLLIGLFSQPCFAKNHHENKSSNSSYKFQVKDAPRHLLKDLQYSVWGPPGLVILAGAGLSLAFYPFDDNIDNNLKNDPFFLGNTDDILGSIISPYTLGGASLVTMLIAQHFHESKLVLAMESSGESLFLTEILTFGVKYAVNRERPNGGNHSFPSGHTSAAFSTASVLTRFYGYKAAIPSFAVASLVGIARMDGRKHFLTDVLAGAVLGSAIGYGTANFHLSQHFDLWLIPQISHNESGIAVYKSF